MLLEACQKVDLNFDEKLIVGINLSKVQIGAILCSLFETLFSVV